MRTRERWTFVAAAVLLVVVLPALNALPQGSPLRVSNVFLKSAIDSFNVSIVSSLSWPVVVIAS